LGSEIQSGHQLQSEAVAKTRVCSSRGSHCDEVNRKELSLYSPGRISSYSQNIFQKNQQISSLILKKKNKHVKLGVLIEGISNNIHAKGLLVKNPVLIFRKKMPHSRPYFSETRHIKIPGL
jgi:hypothetical protein